MAKYQVQAPDGSIITVEGPDGASQDEIVRQAQLLYDKPQAKQDKSVKEIVKDFGKASASLADMGINAVTGALDVAAYPLARAYYGTQMSPEQAAQRAQQETTSPKDVIGRALGITQDPAYAGEASRQIGGYLGENIERSVVQPVSQVTGLPEQDVSSMLGTSTMMAPGALRAVKPAVQATGQAIGDVARGAIGRGTGYIAEPGATPKGYQVPSSRIPLSNEFTRPEDWAKFQRGELPYGQFPPTTPIQQLPTTPLEKGALMLSGGEIPAAGQGFKAFGERLGETYRNPLTAAADIGSMFFTGGVPVITTARGGLAAAQAAADALLARKGFDPALPAQMAGYRSGQIPMPGTRPTPPAAPAPIAGPVVPQQYPLTVQGPGQSMTPGVIPMPGPQRNVNIEGQSFRLPNQINVSNSQAARPQPVQPAQTPKQISMEVAASKIQQPTVQPVIPSQPQMVQPTPRVEPTPLPTETLQVTPPKPTNVTTRPVKTLDEYKQSLIQKYGSEELANKNATDVEAAILRHKLSDSKMANVSVSGSHAKKLSSALAEAEQSGEKIKVTVTGKGGGYDIIYNAGSFAPDPSLTITKTVIRGSNDITFSGVASDGTPFTGQTTGKQTIIKDNNGNVIAEYEGAKKKGPEVSQMLTEDTVFNTKAEWEKANLMNTLAEKKRVGGYKEGDYIVREEQPDYSSIPEQLRKELPERTIVKRTIKGKRVEE